uniref:ATP synthase F0 subunit 8 n=1 Tax=Knipowitschia caucasica TaxID=637954 RepID=A0AAV2J9P1_KNICA
MVMSQGTYTFLACFAGFWMIWAAVVLLCCFCSFLQRRLKSLREEPLTGAESMSCPPQGHPPSHITPAPAEPRETTQLCQPQVCPSQAYQPQLCPSQVCQAQVCQSQVCNLQAVSSTTPLQIPHLLPQANWVTMTTGN